MTLAERVGWLVVALVLAALAIPWFLWGSTTVVVGFPLWLWWHIGWMVLASVVFWVFTKRAWGIGIEPGFERDGSTESASSGPDAGGDRR